MRNKILVLISVFVISINTQLYGNDLSTKDRLDIIDVINKYAHAVDEKDYVLFKTLFIKDVETKFVFDPSFFGGETIIIKGIDDYMEYIIESGSLFRSSQHLIGNSLITSKGDTVKVKSNLNSRGYYKDDINRSVSLWGYYETYLKKMEGNWKIVRHDFYSLGAEE
jgi:ketosteroid isomerase-like protein